jgi:pyruvate kinase
VRPEDTDRPDENFAQDVNVGDRIFIDDGKIALRVVRQDNEQTVCEVIIGGALYDHKGINLPDSEISAPSITERDWQCVDWAIQHNLDFLALSFVRSADEIEQLKDYLRRRGADIKLVAKIEKPQALAHLESIISASDAVLVARGDLGVEMDLAEVPLIQKRVTHMCRRLGKPVVVATQMLQSMIESPIATRAEVADVANAIMDLADAVMLSGETAVGKYPIEAAQTIQRIARVTEAYLAQNEQARPKTITTDELLLTAAIARSVGQIVDDISVRLVAVWSQSGSSARLLSKARIDVPILAMSSEQHNCRQMCLDYGVIPRCQPIPNGIEEFAGMVDKLIISRNWAHAGERIVLVAGQPIGTASATNAIIVHTISAD